MNTNRNFTAIDVVGGSLWHDDEPEFTEREQEIDQLVAEARDFQSNLFDIRGSGREATVADSGCTDLTEQMRFLGLVGARIALHARWGWDQTELGTMRRVIGSEFDDTEQMSSSATGPDIRVSGQLTGINRISLPLRGRINDEAPPQHIGMHIVSARWRPVGSRAVPQRVEDMQIPVVALSLIRYRERLVAYEPESADMTSGNSQR